MGNTCQVPEKSEHKMYRDYDNITEDGSNGNGTNFIKIIKKNSERGINRHHRTVSDNNPS